MKKIHEEKIIVLKIFNVIIFTRILYIYIIIRI